SPYKFNAKELDDETGNYYYGARYLNPKFSIWLSVDPLAEKHPGWSPYNYTLLNPMKLVDPDGREVKGVSIVNGKITYSKQAIKNGTKRYIQARMQTKDGRPSGNVYDKSRKEIHPYFHQ